MKYRYTGSFAIITGFVGQTQGDNFYANWGDILGAKRNGMEIVCHTQNHFDGSSPKFDDKYIFDNLTGCQNDLQTHTGSPLPYLIYPYGHFTPSYVDQALKAGFSMALTVREGSYINTEDLMHVPRVRVNPNESMEKFAEKLNE
jgi:peptidoglycan/xylan/chitin deacetylase (PgdA/CDA1 family)